MLGWVVLGAFVAALTGSVVSDLRRWIYWRRERARVRRLERARRHTLKVLDGGRR